MTKLFATQPVTQLLRKISVSQSEWSSMKKENVVMENGHMITCGIKCHENIECGGVLYHNQTGIFWSSWLIKFDPSNTNYNLKCQIYSIDL